MLQNLYHSVPNNPNNPNRRETKYRKALTVGAVQDLTQSPNSLQPFPELDQGLLPIRDVLGTIKSLPRTDPGQMFLFVCFSIKDPICLKLVRCFCFYSASTKTSFGFCSCSRPLQLKFDQKKSHEKPVIGVTKVANKRYSPYLQLCEKAFM